MMASHIRQCHNKMQLTCLPYQPKYSHPPIPWLYYIDPPKAFIHNTNGGHVRTTIILGGTGNN